MLYINNIVSLAIYMARELYYIIKRLIIGLGTYITIGDLLLSLLLEQDNKGTGPSYISSSLVPPNSYI
jgi:hypothetical protein